MLFHEIKEVDGDERAAMRRVNAALDDWVSRKKQTTAEFDENFRAEFETQTANRYAEIGFIATVNWEPIGLTNGGLPLYQPQIQILGRTSELPEVDYDKIKHDTVTGKIDGVAGYVDPNTGLMKEDPKKKMIL